MFRNILLVFILGYTSCQSRVDPIQTLELKIDSIIKQKKATVGISIMSSDSTVALAWNDSIRFPLQSVFKFHISLAMLDAIDNGKFGLDQPIQVKKTDLLPKDIWSPLRDEYPNGGIFTIAQLIQYSIIQSDNVACDVLIHLLGTPKTVESYIRSKGIEDIELTFNEKNMQAKWENMFQNWTTPVAASKTLKLFYENKNQILSKKSHQFLWQTMIETTTGKNRLKGLLPDSTFVAHKTGSSGTNSSGITAATNDIGIVFLPDEKYFIISVLVTNSREDEKTNERIIAEIAQAAYEHFTTSYN